MAHNIILTREGHAKLKEELEHLKKVRRPQVAERITSAKEYGDLSENAEYHEAKEEQGFVEGRIAEIEEMLKVAHVAEKAPSTSSIDVGSVVMLERDGKKMQYEIVGATEADPAGGKVSHASPLGTALQGKKTGDEVILSTPNGEQKFLIKSVS